MNDLVTSIECLASRWNSIHGKLRESELSFPLSCVASIMHSGGAEFQNTSAVEAPECCERGSKNRDHHL